MTINDVVNNPYMSFNACLRINVYDVATGELKTAVDTAESGWGDVPFDLCEKEVTAMSADDRTIVLECVA